jgi:antitoxin component of MazEF toxin-antitoxin module
MAVEVTVKKWGNSMGVILPKVTIENKHIKENDKILIEVVKEADLSNLKRLKRKRSGQEFKDMVKEGWTD